MYPDIEKAIQLIDAKIAELQNAKRTLLEAFGRTVNLGAGTATVQAKAINANLTVIGTTRKAELVKLLQEQGPLRRSEIIKRSDIPKGTIAYLLNDKDTFVSQDGKWSVAEKGVNEKGLTEDQ